MLKCEAMRLSFHISLASLLPIVMSFGMPSASASPYEEARDLVSKQKWNEALPILKHLYEEEPESQTLAKDLAQVFLRLNRREEALDLLKQHKLTKQVHIAAHSFLSKDSFRFYQQGLDWLAKRAYPQACERFEKALEKDQAQLDILLRLGQCEALDGNGDLALKIFDQLERIHGKTPEVSAWRAKANLLRGKGEEALTVLSNLGADSKTQTEPFSEWVTLWWAEALSAAGQKSQAMAVYDADLRRSPEHLQVHLLSLKGRAAVAESPNQFMQIVRECDVLEKKIHLRKNAKGPKGKEFVVDPFDADALQRGVTELRAFIQLQLPSPSPSATKELSKS